MTELREIPTTPKKGALEKLLPVEKVLEKLNPRQVESEEGIRHTIYTFQSKEGRPIEVLFYSPNELPLIEEEAKGKYVIINGEDPRWRTNEEWEDFSLRVLRASKNEESAHLGYSEQIAEYLESGKVLCFVEAGPEGLLGLVEQLGIELGELKKVLRQIEERKLSEAGLQMLDAIIAGNLIDDRGETKITHSHEGEALYLLSLQGDKKAEQSLAEKQRVIKKMDEKNRREIKTRLEKIRRENEEKGQESLELKSLVAIHATRFMPFNNKGTLEMETTLDSSDWQIPRDTIHFALNHLVAPHMYGTWEAAPYVVISPLEDLMELNDRPTVLNTVDTFWEVGVGRRLKLPEKTALVQPKELQEGEIISGVETNNIYYKSSRITPKDVEVLSREVGEWSRRNLNNDILEIIVHSFSEHPWGDQIELPAAQLKSLVQVTGFFEGKLDVLSDLKEISIDRTVKKVLNMSEIKISDDEIKGIARKIEARIIALIKRVAVEKKSIQMGYEVQPGGMWAWGGSWKVTYQTNALGAKLGVPVMAHTDHISSRAEENAMRGLGALLDEKTPEIRERVNRFEDARKYIKEKFISEVSQKTRRMLYLVGMI